MLIIPLRCPTLRDHPALFCGNDDIGLHIAKTFLFVKRALNLGVQQNVLRSMLTCFRAQHYWASLD